MDQQFFSCSSDKLSKSITGLLLLFAVFLILMPEFAPEDADRTGAGTVLWLTGSSLLLLCAVMYFYAPVQYVLSAGNLRITRRAGDIIVPFDDIKVVRLPAEKELRFPLRTFGNGGLFGYTGRYYTKTTGPMIWQCTRRDRQVIIERNGKLPLVISPDEPVRFVHTSGAYFRPAASGS